MICYVAESYNFSRKTWSTQTISGKNFIEVEEEKDALEIFFKEILCKRGGYRLLNIIIFPDGTKKRKEICSVKKS